MLIEHKRIHNSKFLNLILLSQMLIRNIQRNKIIQKVNFILSHDLKNN